MFTNSIQILILFSSLFSLIYCLSLYLSSKVRYVTFNTILNLCVKKSPSLASRSIIGRFLSANLLLLLFSECEFYQIFSLLILMEPNLANVIRVAQKFKKSISLLLFLCITIIMFTLAVSPAASLLCLVVFQILCYTFFKTVPTWLSILLILLSHDVQLHPGPGYQNNFLNFMNWNLNSISKNDFERVRLIEAHNS